MVTQEGHVSDGIGLPPMDSKDHKAGTCLTHLWMLLVPLNKYLLNDWLNE